MPDFSDICITFVNRKNLHSDNLCMDEKKNIAFIINPISGTQGKEQIVKWLDEKLDKERYEPEILYTERAGHAVEIAAQKAKENAYAVVAIGGDGTINEVARSLAHTETALGIIPCGSGNDFVKNYPNRDFHDLYIGQIVKVLVPEGE